jgi:hypothetical protein
MIDTGYYLLVSSNTSVGAAALNTSSFAGGNGAAAAVFGAYIANTFWPGNGAPGPSNHVQNIFGGGGGGAGGDAGGYIQGNFNWAFYANTTNLGNFYQTGGSNLNYVGSTATGNIAISGGTGNGNVITLNFSTAQPSAPFTVGQFINISGLTPATVNSGGGNIIAYQYANIVVACNTTSVVIGNTLIQTSLPNGTITGPGTVRGVQGGPSAGNSVIVTFAGQTYNLAGGGGSLAGFQFGFDTEPFANANFYFAPGGGNTVNGNFVSVGGQADPTVYTSNPSYNGSISNVPLQGTAIAQGAAWTGSGGGAAFAPYAQTAYVKFPGGAGAGGFSALLWQYGNYTAVGGSGGVGGGGSGNSLGPGANGANNTGAGGGAGVTGGLGGTGLVIIGF